MVTVTNRLGETERVGKVTNTIENDIIATLKEMIEALKKARKENKNKKSKPSKPSQSGKPPRTDAHRSVGRTEDDPLHAGPRQQADAGLPQVLPQPGAGPDPASFKDAKAREQYETVQSELKNLAERQQRIEKITKDLADGKNKTRD